MLHSRWNLITADAWGSHIAGGHCRPDWGGLAACLLPTPWGFAATTINHTPNWVLWGRTRRSGWRSLLAGGLIRQPLLMCEPDGRLHVVCAGIHWRAKRPGPTTEFEVNLLPPEAGEMIHLGAAMNERGDLLLVFLHNKLVRPGAWPVYAAMLPRGGRKWIVRRVFCPALRHCYPCIHFRGDAVDMVLTGDIRETGKRYRWGASSGYRYRFCALTHVWTDNVHRGRWHAKQFDESANGSIFATDIQCLDDGSIHALGTATWAPSDPLRPVDSQGDKEIIHWRTAQRGSGFEKQTIARKSDFAISRFRPDRHGGWHYLLNLGGPRVLHPFGERFCRQRIKLVHSPSWGEKSKDLHFDLRDTKPMYVALARPERWGGDIERRALDLWLADPWGNVRTSPNKTNPRWNIWHVEAPMKG